MDEIMTITYDDKDQAAIDFAKWLLYNKDIQKREEEVGWTLWQGRKALYLTVEELYQIYLKQKQ